MPKLLATDGPQGTQTLQTDSSAPDTPTVEDRADAREFDRLCDAFEAEWKSGGAPSLEEYLSKCAPSARSRLLRELLPLELEYRRDRGESPQSDDYLQRLADHAVTVRDMFSRAARREAAPRDDATRDDTVRSAPPEPTLEHANGTSLNARYVVDGVLGRGGMGVVYRAHDVDLERPLAVKVMRHDLPGSGAPLRKPAASGEAALGDVTDDELSETEHRFFDEARITGQLQHPGIPPVHEVGRLADGQPFIAMKLIEGRTLAQMLRERSSPHDDQPRFLKVFEQIAQTLAYSHAQGVIHRDLKPANVMVGAFGEVQVMDWGLARRLRSDGRGEQQCTDSKSSTNPRGATTEPCEGGAGSSLSLARDSTKMFAPDALAEESGRLTQAGQIIGTLAYMPPEQARGEVQALDERSDVFGLGAILLTLLTGSPPYAGRDIRAVLAKAATADLADAWHRLDECGADGQLVALAKDCLAPAPADRPRDGGEVAQRVSGFLASVQERLQAAEVQRAADQARVAEERKRRRVTVALAICGLLLVAGGAVVGVRLYDQRRETEARVARTERDAEAILQSQAAALAEVQRELSDPVTSRALLDEPLRWQAALDAVAAELKRADNVLSAAPESVDAALSERLQSLQLALTAARRDREIVDQLEYVRMQDGVVIDGETHFAQALPRYEAVFRDAGFDVREQDLPALAARIRDSAIRWPLVAALDHWAAVAREKSFDDVDRLLRLAREADRDPFRDRFRNRTTWNDRAAVAELAADPRAIRQSPQFVEVLGWVLFNRGGDAVPLYRDALSIYPHDYWLLYRAGLIAATPTERAGYLRAATVVRPDSPITLNKLGIELSENGHFEAALHCQQRALELDPESLVALYGVGRMLSLMRRYDEALPYYQRALAGKIAPVDAAMVQAGIALDLHNQGKTEESIALFRKALALHPDYPLAHCNLGLALVEQGQLEEARASYEQAVKLDPKYARGHTSLGTLLMKQGKQDEAVACFRKAIEADPKYATAHLELGVALDDKKCFKAAEALFAAQVENNPRNALANRQLAYALYKQDEIAAAETYYRKAAELDPRDDTVVHNLGAALKQQGKLDEAAVWLRKALELNPKHELAYCNLGNLLHQQKNFKEALTCFQEHLEIKPDSAEGYNGVGIASFELDHFDAAESAYRKALELDPNYKIVHFNLALALDAQAKTDEAMAEYRTATELDPMHANAHRNLGLLLHGSGRFAEAKTLLMRGHELGAIDPGRKDLEGTVVQDCERMLNAEALLPRVLAGEVEPKDAAEYLALADLCRKYTKQYAAALKFHRAAFAAAESMLNEIAAARYNAACTAVMLAHGLGKDELELASGQSEDAAKAELRQLALVWLMAEIADYRLVLAGQKGDDKKMVPIMIRYLPKDDTLDGVHKPDALAALPAAEQEAWREFWRQVDELGKQLDQM